MPATAVLTPTTRCALVTSAPPELPGLSAASVWITSSIVRRVAPSRAGSERPSAETTPAVTEPANPCGLPIATTSWPTRRLSASPSTAGVQVAFAGAQHREVGERVRAGDVERHLAAVDERGHAAARRPAAAAGDDVRGREQEAVRGQHDRAARRRPRPARRRGGARARAGWRPTARAPRPRRRRCASRRRARRRRRGRARPSVDDAASSRAPSRRRSTSQRSLARPRTSASSSAPPPPVHRREQIVDAGRRPRRSRP